ncbi:MAG: isoleucine--tRNA ligase [Acidimicrobiia bacterium]|nr:isoleucine--tRNA ligase [Acidimicrobiia bacterium]
MPGSQPDSPPVSDFTRVPPGLDLPALDARILERWDETGAFQASVEMRPRKHEYTFYDGPPFASGSPHYGHILAGIIKDIVPRYWTMRGHRVERRFGWDTHGLPVEMEVEQQLGISGPRQIEDLGVTVFNDACRRMVEVTTADWEGITRRIGRWVDFRNDYKTMDPEFMESVWWVFRALWDKGLVYRAFKVLPYSWAAGTTLSNFEVSLGGYRDRPDPAITVRLEVLETPDPSGPARPGDYLTIWTTTPWTLPGNLAVAVGPDIDYVAVEDGGRRHWVAARQVEDVFGEARQPAALASGSELLGVRYRPPFSYFEDRYIQGAFRVIPSPSVTTDEGTGLVHMAPAYGEEDLYALADAGLDVIVDPVDLEARFTKATPDLAGLHVFEAADTIIGLLQESGTLLRNERIVHSYPYCYRTDQPLIYKAIPTWFVRVESIRDRMVELNGSIHWVPGPVGANRFGNWLEDARDWAVSRNRFWGSCIPVWECDTCGYQECMGSRADLAARADVWLEDLHKHVVDEVTYQCPSCSSGSGIMARVPEVLDCWFESGSMPYAQYHYPFENEERFPRTFPADFIAEGLDQTRGWFYTLHVLAAALFDEVAFRNCVVNGMILAEDGRKMSKRLKNYPEPSAVLDRYGGDAVRAYLIDSPVLRAEPLRFSEAGVREVVRTVILPFWNAYSFFTTYAEADGIRFDDLGSAPAPADRPEIDRWMLSVLQSLIRRTNEMMEGYYLYAVVGPALGFVNDLTNWYVRRSRRRFWRAREGNEADKQAAFATLYEVLVTFSRLLAPVLPFITEEIHAGLVPGASSVHHTDYPVVDEDTIDEGLERSMDVARTVVTLGRSLRSDHSIGVRQPLARLAVITRDPEVAAAVQRHSAVIAEELNVKEIGTRDDELSVVELAAKPNYKRLGPRLGAAVREVAAALAGLRSEQVASLVEAGGMTIAGHELSADDVVITRNPRPGMAVASDGSLSVALDTALTDVLRSEGRAREVVSRIQRARRDLGLKVTDRIRLRYDTDDDLLYKAIDTHADFIAGEVLAVAILSGPMQGGMAFEIGGSTLSVRLEKAAGAEGNSTT